MATMGVIELTQHLREAGCLSKITFLSVYDEVDFVNAVLGASGTSHVIKHRWLRTWSGPFGRRGRRALYLSWRDALALSHHLDGGRSYLKLAMRFVKHNRRWRSLRRPVWERDYFKGS